MLMCYKIRMKIRLSGEKPRSQVVRSLSCLPPLKYLSLTLRRTNLAIIEGTVFLPLYLLQLAVDEKSRYRLLFLIDCNF